MIEVENLNKYFGPKKVLDQVNTQFERGRAYGVVGENGAGKTTLFRCIAGLEDYTGTIRYSEGVLKNVLGFLPTEPYFFSKITGEEYLRLICNARKVAVPDLNEKNIFELPLNQYASTYSTGMKKKLALTGVLIQHNQIYILDEPFNGVDIQSNMVIVEIIQQLKAFQKTVIVSSHIFSSLVEICDQIQLLKNGKIIQTALPGQFKEMEKTMQMGEIKEKIIKLALG
ncbi:MAG: ABC transporter ATP-binding protein [Saprospiraceae bacterium]|nr:ABC transporter ATP-binding protein [Saprospiraceae bacterium]